MAEPAPRCVVLGGGGHAAVVIDAIEASGQAVVHGILDRDASLWKKELHGYPVLGGDELLAGIARQGVALFVVGVGSVKQNPLRRSLFAAGLAAGLQPLTVRHPTAIVSPRATLGRGVAVLAGAIVNPGAQVGDNAIVNTGAIVEHDCRLGEHAHVASGVRLSGGVQVGADAFVGAGSAVKQQVKIGERAVIGAGSVVLHDVPAGAVVAGNPARPLPAK